MSNKNNEFDVDKFVNKLKQDEKNSSAKNTYRKMINEAINPSTEAVLHIPLNDLESAPKEWNFFEPLPDDKMIELMDSIRENGLQHPIVVWEKQKDNKYMILSGHNRYKAFKSLYELGNTKYETIPAKVYAYNQISELDAQNIIIDTNWVQRDLSRKEKTKSIVKKYAQLHQVKKDKKLYTNEFEKLAQEQLNMSTRNIRRYRKIAELIPEFQEKIFNNELSLISGEKLATLDYEEQMHLYDNYGDELNNKIIKKINKYMTFDDIINWIDSCLEEVDNDTVIFTEVIVRLPKDQEEDFINMFNKWKSRNHVTANCFKQQ